MKNKLILFTLFISMIYIFNACKKSTTTQPDPPKVVADSSYFPADEEAFYRYNIVKTDSIGSQISGERTTLYSGTAVKDNRTYIVQIDNINLTGQDIITDSSFFRKTDGGVYYFLDTTGFSETIDQNELQNLIFDLEMRLLSFPIYETGGWDVFIISYQNIFVPIRVRADFAGIEPLTVNLNSGSRNVNAVKIIFTLSISFTPGSQGIIYSAEGWIAQGIGFVKWEGNATIVGAFTGSGIDFADTTGNIKLDLVEYNRID